jgi:hypothetical protein
VTRRTALDEHIQQQRGRPIVTRDAIALADDCPGARTTHQRFELLNRPARLGRDEILKTLHLSGLERFFQSQDEAGKRILLRRRLRYTCGHQNGKSHGKWQPERIDW